jgi:hypothetical protein
LLGAKAPHRVNVGIRSFDWRPEDADKMQIVCQVAPRACEIAIIESICQAVDQASVEIFSAHFPLSANNFGVTLCPMPVRISLWTLQPDSADAARQHAGTWQISNTCRGGNPSSGTSRMAST